MTTRKEPRGVGEMDVAKAARDTTRPWSRSLLIGSALGWVVAAACGRSSPIGTKGDDGSAGDGAEAEEGPEGSASAESSESATDASTADHTTADGDDTADEGPEPHCGNGRLEPELGEECDDGNLASHDGCSASCQVERKVVKLVGGWYAGYCALREDGTVKCWGGSPLMPSGTGSNPGTMGGALPALDLGSVTVTDIAAHTGLAYLDDTGTLRLLGLNVLPDHSIEQWHSKCYACCEEPLFDPEYGPLNPVLGDDPWELGDAIPIVPIGKVDRIYESVPGCVRRAQTGETVCWGRNSLCALAVADCGWSCPEDEECPETFAGVYCTSESFEGARPALFGSYGSPEQIVGGSASRCGRWADGTVRCWGISLYGSLGLNALDYALVGSSPEELGDALPVVALPQAAISLAGVSNARFAVLADGTVTAWGYVCFDETFGCTSIGGSSGGVPEWLPTWVMPEGRKATAVVTSGAYADRPCALLDDGRAVCWLNNHLGLPAQGTKTAWYPDPSVLTPIDLGEPIVELVHRGSSACALLESGRVKCWGRARSYENDEILGDDPGEVGPDLPYVELD